MLRIPFSIAFTAIALGTVSCSGMLDSNQPAERVYWLEPLLIDAIDGDPRERPGLSVAVAATPGLDTDRILILEPDARLNHYASARWPDNSREVMDALLRATLESSGLYSRVFSDSASQSADQELNVELRAFYVTPGAAGHAQSVRVSLAGYIDCDDSSATIVLDATSTVHADRLGAIVAAFQSGLNDVSRQLVDKLSNTC